MNTFADLVKNWPMRDYGQGGIDQSPQDMVNQRLDPVIQQYNSHWGVVSDTHMIKDPKCPDCYIITGHMINTPQWEEFIYAPSWGGYSFKFYGTNQQMSLAIWASQVGMEITTSMYGGDIVACMHPRIPKEIKIQNGYYTSESKIPRNLRELEYEPGYIQELFESNDIDKILEGLNGRKVLGKEWVYNDGVFVGKLNNKLLFIK